MDEIKQATDALLEAIRHTETYQSYAALRESVMLNEGYRALLRRFTSAQTALQMAALASMDAKDEDVAAFEQLSALLYSNPELTDYLLAQMKVQQLAASVMERITRAVDMDVSLPAL